MTYMGEHHQDILVMDISNLYILLLQNEKHTSTQTSTLNARTHTATQEKTLFNCCVTRMKVVRFGNSFNFFAPT